MRTAHWGILALVIAWPSIAAAQDAAPPPPPPGAGQPPPPPPGQRDGVRFRGAIAAAGGGEFISGFTVGMGGLEGRLGVQINNLLGFYIQPSLSFGGGTVSSGGVTATALTGTAGVSGLVDLTIANRFFIGAGAGVGVLNNPVGPEVHIRLGGYPLFGYGLNGFTRKGLMVGVDSRFFFLSAGSQSLTVMQLMAEIGFEVY